MKAKLRHHADELVAALASAEPAQIVRVLEGLDGELAHAAVRTMEAHGILADGQDLICCVTSGCKRR